MNSCMRTIYLPELLTIRIQNFSLYPNGLDYEYSFVKGVNLVLGGNGMGKTTFVNIVKHSIIGNYKKRFDYTRTYKGNIIEKRLRYADDYFKKRMDNRIETNDHACVIVCFKIGDNLFSVKRDLEDIRLLEVSVNGNSISGNVLKEKDYEALKEVDREESLQFKYEKEIERYSGLSFNDLIFFVNEILYFGEDHKTILWHGENSEDDVQNELFNKYFNSPELDWKRQEAQRKAKYYDSLSRHRSEDIRAIRKVLDKINKDKNGEENFEEKIIQIKDKIAYVDAKIDELQHYREKNDEDISLARNQLNRHTVNINELETKKDSIESSLIRSSWETLHPLYEDFIENIKVNHICPICTKTNEKLFNEVSNNKELCFLCKQQLHRITNENRNEDFVAMEKMCSDFHKKIKNIQIFIKGLEEDNKNNDQKFNKLKEEREILSSKLRTVEYANSKNDTPDQLQEFYDEIKKLDKEKNDYQALAQKSKEEAEAYSQKIESEIKKNAQQFSSLFSGFASQFLGVPCELTYDDFRGQGKRFYPIVDKILRLNEEELSESQRFFVDHSFRMSILSFFYSNPTFYIVETPDSSLDISYEQNAANVFLKFLENPNSLIITSNLNNSTFLDYIVSDKQHINVSLVGLPDIAKKSVIQSVNKSMINIYNEFKTKIM